MQLTAQQLNMLANIKAQYPEYVEYLSDLDKELSERMVSEESGDTYRILQGGRRMLKQQLKDLNQARDAILKLKANTNIGSHRG